VGHKRSISSFDHRFDSDYRHVHGNVKMLLYSIWVV
jgi:hypothetical protein